MTGLISRRSSFAGREVFQVYKCRPVIRHNNLNGNASKLLIITFLQKVYVGLKGTSYQGYLPEDEYAMRGGATLIIDLATYEIKYAIIKNVASSERLKDQKVTTPWKIYTTPSMRPCYAGYRTVCGLTFTLINTPNMSASVTVRM